MQDNIWETFDELYKLIGELKRKVTRLEARTEALECRLREHHPVLVIDKPISFEIVKEQP